VKEKLQASGLTRALCCSVASTWQIIAALMFAHRADGVMRRKDIYQHLIDEHMSPSKVYRHMGYLVAADLVDIEEADLFAERAQMLTLYEFRRANDVRRLRQHDERRRVQSRLSSRAHRARIGHKQTGPLASDASLSPACPTLAHRDMPKDKYHGSDATCSTPSSSPPASSGEQASTPSSVSGEIETARQLEVLATRDDSGEDPDFEGRCGHRAQPYVPPAGSSFRGPLRSVSAAEVAEVVEEHVAAPEYGSVEWIDHRVRSVTRLREANVDVLLREGVSLRAINAAIDAVLRKPIGTFTSDPAAFVAAARRFENSHWSYRRRQLRVLR
jgi:hypothetical protein